MAGIVGFEIKDGEYTKTIYTMIKEQRQEDEKTMVSCTEI